MEVQEDSMIMMIQHECSCLCNSLLTSKTSMMNDKTLIYMYYLLASVSFLWFLFFYVLIFFFPRKIGLGELCMLWVRLNTLSHLESIALPKTLSRVKKALPFLTAVWRALLQILPWVRKALPQTLTSHKFEEICLNSYLEIEDLCLKL